jgi:hypothetical protein
MVSRTRLAEPERPEEHAIEAQPTGRAFVLTWLIDSP